MVQGETAHVIQVHVVEALLILHKIGQWVVNTSYMTAAKGSMLELEMAAHHMHHIVNIPQFSSKYLENQIVLELYASNSNLNLLLHPVTVTLFG